MSCPGPLRREGALLVFGAQRVVAELRDEEYAPTLAASPGLVHVAEVVARELERLAQGVGAPSDELNWCVNALRGALPKGASHAG